MLVKWDGLIPAEHRPAEPGALLFAYSYLRRLLFRVHIIHMEWRQSFGAAGMALSCAD